MDAAPLRLGLVAGEASGDLLGGLLLAGLRQRWPALQTGGHRRAQDGRPGLRQLVAA
jgi:lipid-A-disaccharide synthase